MLALIAVTAFVATGVSLVSGFGLGTVLLPVFALFLPLPVAVAATALVHLASNALKFVLMARHASAGTATRFGLPAAAGAIAGAELLGWIDQLPPLGSYALGGRTVEVVAVKAVIGVLIVAFALLELARRTASTSLSARWMPLGGLLSGFFGGLSGHQGALRSAFLLRARLPKEQFVATGVVCAVLIDITRTTVYGLGLLSDGLTDLREAMAPVAVAIVFAFAGVLAGRRLLRAITYRCLQRAIAGLMLAVGFGLASGLL